MNLSRPRSGGMCCLLAFLLPVLTLAPSTLQATRVRPVNLEQLTAHAETIFAGRCIAVERVEDQGRRGVEATFEVSRTVKGSRGDRITVRIAEDALSGMPRFATGEAVVLFLYGKSAGGWTSPVGLGQGKFTVVDDTQGKRRALNSLGNAPLFENLSDRARDRLQQVGQDLESEALRGVSPGELLDLVESLLR